MKKVMLANFVTCAIEVTGITHPDIASTCVRLRQSKIPPPADISVKNIHARNAQDQNLLDLMQLVLVMGYAV